MAVMWNAKKTGTPMLEKSKRGAAAMANATKGMARVLTPNKKLYKRKSGKGVPQ